MTTASWITMIVVLGFVWGGFAVALRMAIRSESTKSIKASEGAVQEERA